MIWIITAMPQEADLIIPTYNLKLIKSYPHIKFYQNNNILLVVTGIWKIQASIGTSLMLQNYSLEKIINIGIAGNTWLETKSQVWDVFLVNKVLQHDGYLPFEWNHLDYFKKPITLPDFNIKWNFDFNIFKWTCATWDQFIADENKISQIKQTYQAHLVDMEAFAVASTVREFNQLDKLIIIKAVSDWANQQALTDHEKNLEIAMKNSIKVLSTILN